jgi:hypothetical protein
LPNIFILHKLPVIALLDIFGVEHETISFEEIVLEVDPFFVEKGLKTFKRSVVGLED